MDKPKRLVYVFDIHFPYCIPAFYDVRNPKKETPFLNFLKDFQPHYMGYGGDQLDLDVIAHWNKGKPRLIENKRLKGVYDDFNIVLDSHEKVLKSAERKIMHQGNHELWVDYLVDEFPAVEGLVEVQEKLNVKSRGMEWIDNRKHAKVGKLYFIHGNYSDRYASVQHTKAVAQIYGRSVVYGHFHTNQIYAAKTPFDEHAYQTTSVGCMGNVNPMWKRNEPSAWVNSFYVAYILPSGNYHGYIVNIIENQFVFDSVVYK